MSQRADELNARRVVRARSKRHVPNLSAVNAALRDEIATRRRAEEKLTYHAHLLDDVHDAVIATDVRFVVTAVAKHARARNVNIVLQRRSDHVSLIVEDDGIGFDIEQALDARDKRLGLAGMRERATLLSGTLDVESRPGHGTTVVARIPAPARPELATT